MTKKEMLINLRDNYGIDDKEMIDFLNKEIERLTRKPKEDKLLDVVFAAVPSDNFAPIADIVATINDPEVTTSKVIARLTKLIAAEKIEKTELKEMKIMGYKKIV